MTTLTISKFRYSKATWPRQAIDEERVVLFATLLGEGETLPPIEVVPAGNDTFDVADGVHRTMAALRAGRTEIEVVFVVPIGAESPAACAYRRALETACQTALALSKEERRKAALYLSQTRGDLSRRAIARLVGVAHSTVDRWVDLAESTTEEDDAPERPVPTPDEIALRFVKMFERLSDSRQLFDLFGSGRMGQHIAGAFVETYGNRAPKEARLVKSWLDRAVAMLEESE
jgi:hypothetical protein